MFLVVLTPTERLTGTTAVVMIPQPVYRYFDLTSDDPLQKIDLQFYAADYSGALVPIPVEPGQAMNIKLIYDRKTASDKHLHIDERLKSYEGGRWGAKRQCL